MLYRVLRRILILVVTKCSLGAAMPEWKYCRQIGPCKPGQHIMCLYYNPASLSNNCNGRSMVITMENRDIILTKINKLRWQTRHGKVRGKNNILLPKGYGLKNLEWDDELARFAQIWANQCSFTNANLCRATERFPNPGQFMGGIEYSYANIEDYNALEVLARANKITRSRASDIIEAVLNLVYNMKNYVTRDMVLEYKDNDRSNVFLLAVHGNTTHIGCAMSYWIVMNDDEVNSGYDYYKTALVCNLSAQPAKGKKVYETSLSRYQQTKKLEDSESNKNSQNTILPSVVLMPIVNKEEEISSKEINKAKKKPSTNQRRKTNKPPKRKITDRYFKIPVAEVKHQNNKTVTRSSGNSSLNMKSPSTKDNSVLSRAKKVELPSQPQNLDIISYNDISRNNLLLNHLHSALKLTNKDFFRLKELMSKYSAKEQSEALNLIMQPSTNVNTTKYQTYGLEITHASESPNVNNFIAAMDKELVHAMNELVQKSGVGIDEIVNVTTNIINDDKATNHAVSTYYNKRYRQNGNHNNAEYKTISNDVNTLELRNQNPFMEYDKNVINKNDYNNEHGDDYNTIKNNIRNIRKTADLNDYRKYPTSSTGSIDRHSFADMTGSRIFDENNEIKREEFQKNRGFEPLLRPVMP